MVGPEGAIAQRMEAVAAPFGQLVPSGQLALAAYVRPFLDWASLVRELSPATIASYQDAVTSFLEFCDRAGIQSPAAVKVRTIETYVAWLRHEKGLSVSTANHRRAALATLWRFLIREEVATSNPAADAYALRGPKRLPQYLSPTEQDRALHVLARATELRANRAFAIVATLNLCGLRASELCALELGDVDLETGIVRVNLGKGSKDRLIPLLSWMRGVLHWYIEKVRPRLVRDSQTQALFLNRRGTGPMGPKSLWVLVSRAVSPIVGRHAHPHALRHSFATRALEGGGNTVGLQMAMGHSSPTTTAIYTHIPDPQYRAKLAAWLATGELPAGPWNEPPAHVGPESTAGSAPSTTTPPTMPSPPSPAADGSHPYADRALRARLRDQRRSRKRRRP
ncbi:MAG: tyrosine-type recombinase/integrase [Candidatus Rokuibacteriota bacterium]